MANREFAPRLWAALLTVAVLAVAVTAGGGRWAARAKSRR